MNSILSLLRIPLIRFIGVVVILYFALFSNKHNPDSLRNRLSKENIEQNLHDVQAKGRFIVSNIKVAQDVSNQQAQSQILENKISLTDVKIGVGDISINCGDEAEISYEVLTENGVQIKNVSSEKIIVGSNLNKIIEKNILNMKQDGIRNINIPENLITDDSKISELLKFHRSNIRYQIRLLSIIKNSNPKFSC